MAATKKQTTKKARVKKQQSYKSFKLSKKIKHRSDKTLPGIVGLIKLSLRPIGQNRKLFLGLITLQFIISLVFIIGIDSVYSFLAVKEDVNDTLEGIDSTYSQSFALFEYVIGLGADGAASSFQFFVGLIFSLAIIWSIRQVLAGQYISLKQAFYEGMYPLIPFLIILLIIGLQLLPFTIGNFILNATVAGGVAVTLAEQILWWIIFSLLTLLSAYMILSSIFALYIVTLPEMTPLKALRSAKGIVMHRRIKVGLRLIGLPALGILFYAAVLLPLILVAPILVIPMFALLGSFGLFFVHSYIYNLYRELL